MPSGDAAVKNSPRVGIPDRMQFQSGNDVHQRQWFPDERDAFISWLRAEFAAANAIIDSLCYHLRCIGEPGEYDVAIGCIQQRRSTWTSVLHMQQYFSVADVVHSFQQVAWRRQPRHLDPASAAGSYLHPKPEPKKPAMQIVGGRHGNRSMAVARENHGSDADIHFASQEASPSSVNIKKSSADDTSGPEVSKPDSASSSLNVISSDNNEGAEMEKKGSNGVILEAVGTKSGEDSEGHHRSNVQKDDSDSKEKQDGKQNGVPVPKTFMNSENLDGKAVHVVEGLELYEDLFDSSEISKLFSLASELRAAGRRSELQGQTFVPSKRPMKGRGREALQFGVPIIDGPPEDDNGTGISKDRKVEQIPGALQDIADRLVQLQVINVKPDSCVIDFFNEGDHSQPHVCPPWFGRPFCGLVLTKCIMVFGRVINIDHPGDYRGSLRLSLSAGSLLVMKGRSADFAKHAIPSIRKQRIIVTFTKSQPKRLISNDGMRIQSSVPPAPWAPPPRLPNMVRHPNPKYYSTVPSTGVLPVPPARPHLPATDIQPIFVGASGAPAVAYPPPPVAVPVATSGWPSVTRPPPPRMLVPGTGVFLPPAGPGHSPSQQQGGTTSGESSSPGESACENQPQNGQLPEKNSDKSNSNVEENVEPKGEELAGKVSKQETEESVSSGGKAEEDKEEQGVGKKKQNGKTSGPAK